MKISTYEGETVSRRSRSKSEETLAFEEALRQSYVSGKPVLLGDTGALDDTEKRRVMYRVRSVGSALRYSVNIEYAVGTGDLVVTAKPRPGTVPPPTSPPQKRASSAPPQKRARKAA